MWFCHPWRVQVKLSELSRMQLLGKNRTRTHPSSSFVWRCLPLMLGQGQALVTSNFGQCWWFGLLILSLIHTPGSFAVVISHLVWEDPPWFLAPFPGGILETKTNISHVAVFWPIIPVSFWIIWDEDPYLAALPAHPLYIYYIIYNTKHSLLKLFRGFFILGGWDYWGSPGLPCVLTCHVVRRAPIWMASTASSAASSMAWTLRGSWDWDYCNGTLDTMDMYAYMHII